MDRESFYHNRDEQPLPTDEDPATTIAMVMYSDRFEELQFMYAILQGSTVEVADVETSISQ